MKEFKFDNVSIIYKDKDVGIGKRKLTQIILVTLLFSCLYLLIMYLTFKFHFTIMFLLLGATWFHKEILRKILEQYENVTPYSKLVYDILHMENLQNVNDKGIIKLIVNNNEQSVDFNEFFKDFNDMQIIKDVPLGKDCFVIISCVEEKLKIYISNIKKSN